MAHAAASDWQQCATTDNPPRLVSAATTTTKASVTHHHDTNAFLVHPSTLLQLDRARSPQQRIRQRGLCSGHTTACVCVSLPNPCATLDGSEVDRSSGSDLDALVGSHQAAGEGLPSSVAGAANRQASSEANPRGSEKANGIHSVGPKGDNSTAEAYWMRSTSVCGSSWPR